MSGCFKGLAEYLIYVPQAVGPILQLLCCPRKQWRACGTLRKHFTKPLEQPDAPDCIVGVPCTPAEKMGKSRMEHSKTSPEVEEIIRESI